MGRLRWIIRFAVFGLALLLAVSLLVMSLWNWLLPPLLGLPAIGLAQAAGLLLLTRMLFGGLRGGGRGWGGGWHARRRFAERWQQMTPEERQRFRAGMRGRCGPPDLRGDDGAPPAAASA